MNKSIYSETKYFAKQLLLKPRSLKAWADNSMQKHLNTPTFFCPCFFCLWCYDAMTFNTLRSRQNGRYFTDGIFKRIFVNENVWIAVDISLKFIDSDNGFAPTRRQAIIWIKDGLVYWRIYASLGPNELKVLNKVIWRYDLTLFNTISATCNALVSCRGWTCT